MLGHGISPGDPLPPLMLVPDGVPVGAEGELEEKVPGPYWGAVRAAPVGRPGVGWGAGL